MMRWLGRYRLGRGLVFLVVGALALFAAADAVNGWAKSDGGCFVIRLVDGDTVDAYCPRIVPATDIATRVPKGRHRVRLTGFDTAEFYSPRCFAEWWHGWKGLMGLKLALFQAERIAMIPLGTDHYGRRLMAIRLGDGLLADQMVDWGLAVPYQGGRRINWCARLAAG